MNIGLITIYQVPNYGSVLQAYATQYILQNMGASCSIINYKYPNEWHWKQGTPKPNKIRVLYRKLFPDKKSKVLEDFRKTNYNLTKIYNSLDDLKKEDWNKYDAFIVGSDQVWNPRFTQGDSVFLLSFVPDDKPRYSIASSFASERFPNDIVNKFKYNLSKFSAISVREQKGIEIINNTLGINTSVEVLLDPTLLLNKEEWLKAISRSTFKKKRPYILFYMWTYAFEPRPYIFKLLKHFQDLLDCDVIALEGFTKQEYADGIRMQNYSKASIPEFIDIFNNADLVITSSFHGTAFALNFGIPVLSVVPEGNSDDRQTNLLKSLGCAHCAVTCGTPIKSLVPKYDVNKVQNELKKIRTRNLDWIKTNIL